VLSLLSGGLQILLFPKTDLFFLCWIAFVPLLYALLRGRGGEGELLDSEGRSLRPFTLLQGFVVAWVCGIVWYIGICYWIYPVMRGYGNLGVFTSGLITLGFCLIMGMHHGVFGLLVVLMARRATVGNRRPLLLAPVFWIAIEFFRDRITGVPWEPLGNAQVDNIPFSRIAEFTGVYGLSFAIMLVNCAFTAGLLFYGRRRKNLLISATAAAVALQVGVFLKPAPLPSTRQALLIQPNIPILDTWTPDMYARIVADFVQSSEQAGLTNSPGNPGLIVWPEAPIDFRVDDPSFLQVLKTIAQRTNAYLIVGSTAFIDGPKGRQPLNSALVVDSQGNVMGRYDKIHLVPFGEYTPLKNLLFFAEKLTHEVGDFASGTERKVFDLNGTKVAAVICYESVFPGEVREFTTPDPKHDAQVLVNISNDGWYGESSAPYQHLQMTRMRAIENHRWILLATNNGITASIDPLGRVVKNAERNISTVLAAPFSAELVTTFYSHYGDIFAWICVVLSLLAIFVRFRFAARTMIEARPT
jgi:apolipoprotein N-acyltransferase